MFGRSAPKPKESGGKIFISYRRNDSKAITDRIFAWLNEQYGRDAVFYDIDTLPPGADWRAHIREEVGKARVVLAIISGQWLTEIQSRSTDANDVLRFELETALARGMAVIPVLIERTEMPQATELPASLARLPDLNAATVHEARYFFTDMETLAERLATGWGFERRLATLAINGKARPATANLVVPSTYRGPAVPPPKVGEKWEQVLWPKLAKRSWQSLFDPTGSLPPSMATWMRPRYSFSSCRLAVTIGYQIGFVDFSEKEYRQGSQFSFFESTDNPWKKNLRLPTGRIAHIMELGDGVVFAAGGMLCFNEADARFATATREDLWVDGANHRDAAKDAIISSINAKGLWVHGAREKTSSFYYNIYSGKKRIGRVSGGQHYNSGDGRFDWAPSGNYAVVGNYWNDVSLVKAKTQEGFSFLDIYDEKSKKYLFEQLPENNECRHWRSQWHPAKDILASFTYGDEKFFDGERQISRARDWHVAVYDAATLRLLYALPVDETRSLNRLTWNSTGRFVACGGDGRCIFVLDLSTGATNKLFGHSAEIGSLDFSPDGQRLLSSGGGRCIVWNPENGERVAEWSGSAERGRVRESPWSPDGTMVVTSGWEVRRLVV